MIDQLFGSKTRSKLLKLFYSNPNRSFYVREITRKIDEQINSVRRELANLLSLGIISSDNTNNRLYYEVNQKFQYYDPLSTIFGNQEKDSNTKSSKKAKVEEKNNPLFELGNVDLAIVTGQFTRDETSGIDFLIVGDISQSKLQNYITEWEANENKEIRYVVMSTDEYKYREQINDRFLSMIKSAKKQVILDKSGLLKNNKED